MGTSQRMLLDLARIGGLLQLCFPAERVVMALRTSKVLSAMLLQDGGAQSVVLQLGAEPNEGDNFEAPSPSVIARSVKVLSHLRKEVIFVDWSPLVRTTSLTAAKEIALSRSIHVVRLRIHSAAQLTACLNDLIDIAPAFFDDLRTLDARIPNGESVCDTVNKILTVESGARSLYDLTLRFPLGASLLPKHFDPAMQSLGKLHPSRKLTVHMECDYSLNRDAFVNAITQLARARTYVTDGGAKKGMLLAHLHIVLWVDGMRDFDDMATVPSCLSLHVIGVMTRKLSLVVNVRKWPRKTTELLDCWLSGALTGLHHAPNVRKLDVKVRVLNKKYRRVLRPYKKMLTADCKQHKIAFMFSVK